ncbi:MAG: esterase [Pseudomonadales bacterium]|nr:esterase [Pseudomonadales bacterium]|tara:strand:- start:2271 stop:3440 length:1170 start_codon:yes stop_codon:yes gene_type:complete
MKQGIRIGGVGHEQFPALREAFEENFIDRGEVGASVAVTQNNRLVASFWGGYKHDPGAAGDTKSEQWQKDTLVNVWSTTKGVAAVCAAMLVERGKIGFNTPLAEFWPAFAEKEKRAVTLASLLSHQAGLCGFRQPVSPEHFYDLDEAASELSEMTPFWTPGSGHGYHALTIGILLSTLFRRVDGRSLKEFVEQELATRFGLDIHIGLPERLSGQASGVIAPADMSTSNYATELTDAQKAALMNPLMSPDIANTQAWRAADNASANGFATAESLALLYGALATDGTLGSATLLGKKVLEQAITPQTDKAIDLVLGMESQWACGFLMNTLGIYGPNPSAFGHSGWGGSFAFADRDKGVSCAYTMNRMGTVLVGEPRASALISALYQDLNRH